MVKKHPFTVTKGKLILTDRQALLMDSYQFEGKEGYITLNRKTNSRSNNQNRYYFGIVCKLIGDYCGYSQDEMHLALRMKFLKECGPNDLVTAKSTTKLTTAEMEDYLENIRRWASIELGVYVPLPGEVI